MKSKDEPKTYEQHRQNQRERILEAAEALFIREGIDNVSMGAIAKAARIARKTLYEYFPNKQEIAFAIFQLFLDQQYAEFDLKRIPQGTGFERIEFMVMDMINIIQKYPEYTRFLVEFDTLYAREGDPARVRQVYHMGSDILVEIIQEGIRDGSIRSDLTPEALSAAIFNLISGMNSRFALLGKQVSEEFGVSINQLYRDICRIFLRGIQANPDPQE
ncbi:MAG: TetR/AcrR family transcriptional regulator [Anaerolineaceae bacterium]|nr:TetR/AcrR family transcriptional regulator [Anaerolineaceae bacterium]